MVNLPLSSPNKTSSDLKGSIMSTQQWPSMKNARIKPLDDLLLLSPENMIISLKEPKFRFEFYIKMPIMNTEMINKLTVVVNKAFECTSNESLMQDHVHMILSSEFFWKHLFFALCKPSPFKELIEMWISIFSRFLALLPSSQPTLARFKNRLQYLVNDQLKNPTLLKSYNQMDLLYQAAVNINKVRNKKTLPNLVDSSEMTPPDDFTDMNIIPKLSDILSNQTNQFLRKNITNGAYQNVKHYLDVQFRLLREDFLLPLREGVKKLRDIVDEAKIGKNDRLSQDIMQRISRIESLSTYFDCRIEDTLATDHGVVHQVRLSPEKVQSINWEFSKRLLFGSLVCLSNDFFENNCLIGSICDRDIENLKEGIIYVRFGVELSREISYNGRYILLETSAFFESYKHVLHAMVSFQRAGEADFPFKENLVYCRNKSMPMPRYLNNVNIDFRPIVDRNRRLVWDFATRELQYFFSPSSITSAKCSSTNKATWPSAQQMSLDPSQYEAVKLALDNKLALIQGPPGTGKTFIGVKIVELLLHNKHLWWNRSGDQPNRHHPILMICYTNHALDQFLEYCVDQCGLTQGVVRVGGQSKSEKLEAFKLANIKRTMRNKNRKSDTAKEMKKQRAKLNSIGWQFDRVTRTMSMISSGRALLRFRTLEKLMSAEQVRQFKSNVDLKGDDFKLLEWLGFFVVNEDQESKGDNSSTSLDTTKVEGKDESSLMNSTIDSEVGSVIDMFKKLDLQKQAPIIDKEKEIFNPEIKQSFTLTTQKEVISKPPKMVQTSGIIDASKEENIERMLEEDIETGYELEALERERAKEFEEISMRRGGEFLFMDEVEEMRQVLFSNRKIPEWKVKLSSKQLREIKANINSTNSTQQPIHQSEIYMRSMLDRHQDRQQDQNNNHISIPSKQDLNDLNYEERFALYMNCLNKYKSTKQAEIDRLSKEYNEIAQKLQELRLQMDRHILENAYIIAMTTTGSSRYHSVLKDIGPRIVIVEEAAEVFESHIVASLSKNTEHLILIGDHVQLRPNPAVYVLAKDFNLDVSLFERLINNDTKKVMLSCQHRMRPEISLLMRHFYPQSIQDHSSVFLRPSIVGLKKDVFFISHDVLEDRMRGDEASTTKINRYEAEYAVKLAEYLLKQRQFGRENITILTMYLGQMSEIRHKLRDMDMAEVKCMTVDNYQGEENEIIILSLVRANKHETIGFLNVFNRVCVALSRARCGFYVIGNFEFICKAEKQDMWKDIVNTMKQNDSFGSELLLTCRRHPENDISVKRPSDFDLRPDGGCHLPCTHQYSCGHKCPLSCHTFDTEHKELKCERPCDKIMSRCGHKCQKTCSHSGNCDVCWKLVKKLVPGCRHEILMRCDQEPVRSDCGQPCKKLLSCGHECIKSCGEEKCEPCIHPVKVDLACSHGGKVEFKCSEVRTASWRTQFKCAKQCGAVLDCGHKCRNTCADCLGSYIHSDCTKKSAKTLSCGHKTLPICPKNPTEKDLICEERCPNRCSHTKCSKQCSQSCTPCTKPCTYACDHFKCTRKCHESCNRPPCNRPCPMRFETCGHRCIGFCGEPCPPLCRICHRDKVCTRVFGAENEPQARFVYIEECGHSIESTAMDQWINRQYVGVVNEKLPQCPICMTSIRYNPRYSSIIKSRLAHIETLKLAHFGDAKKNRNALESFKTQVKSSIKQKNDEKDFGFVFGRVLSDCLNEIDMISEHTLASYKNAWDICQMTCKIGDETKKRRFSSDEAKNRLRNEHINMELKKIRHYIFNDKEQTILTHSHNIQIMSEILNEAFRLEAVLNFYKISNALENMKLTDGLKEAFNECESDLIRKINQYKGDVKSRVESNLKLLASKANLKLI